MSKTDLTYIDRAFANVLERQTKSVPASVKKEAASAAVRNVGGFHVTDSTVADNKIAAHIDTMKRYAVNRAKLISDLEAKGIPTLATLPESIWNNICNISGLLRVLPAANGKVYIEGLPAFEKKINGRAASIVGNATLVILTAMFYGVSLKLFPAHNIADYIITVAMAFIPSVVFTTFLYGVGLGNVIENAIFRRMVRRCGEQGLLKRFTIKTANMNYHSGESHTTLILPTPPPEVHDVVLKMEKSGKHMLVAATPDAMSFNPTLTDMVFATKEKRRAEEARLAEIRRAAWADPILYTVQDGVVAIVAQFGDFPVEKELVDRLVADEVTEEAYY